MDERRQLLIGGNWVDSEATGSIDVISASTEEVIGRVPDAVPADIDRAVAAARTAFESGPWPALTAAERAGYLTALSQALQRRDAELSSTITAENGTPSMLCSMIQVFPATMTLDYYAGLATETPLEERREGMLGGIIVQRVPVGVVAAVVPWNVPLYTAALKLGPALAAGCTVVLKPSPETALDAYLLAEALVEIGLPPGVVNVVVADRATSEYLVTHPDVDKVAFTGSTAAGRKIAAACGDLLRPVTLELGGKSAAIVLDDADVAQVAESLDADGVDDAQRTGLHRPDPHLGPAVPLRRGGRGSDGEGPQPGGRRSVRSQHHHRATRGRPPARSGRVLHRPRPAGGGEGHRRRGPPGPPVPGLVRRADRADQRRQPHAGRPGGDLRPGRGRDPLRGHRRRHPPGQPVRLRPGRRRVHGRPGPGPRCGPPDDDGDRHPQRDRPRDLRPLRGGQAVRPGPGAGTGRPRRLLQSQVHHAGAAGVTDASNAAPLAPRAIADVPSWEAEADVVIVGYGCAGASAAIEARQAGADVLVVERATAGGGASAMAGGEIYLGGGTAVQKACGFDDTPEAMYAYLMAATGPGPNQAKVEVYCDTQRRALPMAGGLRRGLQGVLLRAAVLGAADR
jgi:hypothetical protein